MRRTCDSDIRSNQQYLVVRGMEARIAMAQGRVRTCMRISCPGLASSEVEAGWRGSEVGKVASALKGDPGVPISRRVLNRVFWGLVLLHVAAVVAVVAAYGGGGAWVLNGDAAFSDCDRAVSAAAVDPDDARPYGTGTKTVSNWPVTYSATSISTTVANQFQCLASRPACYRAPDTGMCWRRSS